MKKVLFLCVGNSCRSQMAEGFARYYGKGIIEAHSVGTMPAAAVSKTAIRVMKERGSISPGKNPNCWILPH